MREGLLTTPTSQMGKLRFRKSRTFPKDSLQEEAEPGHRPDSEAWDIHLFMTELPFPKGKEKRPDRGELGSWAASPEFFLLHHLSSCYLKGVKGRRANTHSQQPRKPTRPPGGAVPPLPPAGSLPMPAQTPCHHRDW